MSEKFFQKGSYLLRLDDIRPREAKPNKRIHLNCSMVLSEDDISAAPTQIRRVWEIVANPKLDTFHVPISSQMKGIEIELYPTEPYEKTPLLVAIKNTILRDIRIDREKLDEKNWEVRLRFSLGIQWDTAVWKWGEDYVFLECFARFSQSQAELFDDNPADAVIATPETERLRGVEVEDLARDLGTNAPAVTESPAIDPLRADSETKPRKRGRPKLVPNGKGSARDVRSHA